MGATPDWDAPCQGKYAHKRDGRHSLQRVAKGPRRPGFCRECGAREPSHVNGEEVYRLEQAILAFRDACDALEPLMVGIVAVIRTDLDEKRVSAIARWRETMVNLRKSEAIGG